MAAPEEPRDSLTASGVPAENPDGRRGPGRPANTRPPPAWPGPPLAVIRESPAWGTRLSPPPAPEGLSSAGKGSRIAGSPPGSPAAPAGCTCCALGAHLQVIPQTSTRFGRGASGVRVVHREPTRIPRVLTESFCRFVSFHFVSFCFPSPPRLLTKTRRASPESCEDARPRRPCAYPILRRLPSLRAETQTGGFRALRRVRAGQCVPGLCVCTVLATRVRLPRAWRRRARSSEPIRRELVCIKATWLGPGRLGPEGLPPLCPSLPFPGLLPVSPPCPHVGRCDPRHGGCSLAPAAPLQVCPLPSPPCSVLRGRPATLLRGLRLDLGLGSPKGEMGEGMGARMGTRLSPLELPEPDTRPAGYKRGLLAVWRLQV